MFESDFDSWCPWCPLWFKGYGAEAESGLGRTPGTTKDTKSTEEKKNSVSYLNECGFAAGKSLPHRSFESCL